LQYPAYSTDPGNNPTDTTNTRDDLDGEGSASEDGEDEDVDDDDFKEITPAARAAAVESVVMPREGEEEGEKAAKAATEIKVLTKKEERLAKKAKNKKKGRW
jgi:hypothetical protein